jgi:hypothetical protein
MQVDDELLLGVGEQAPLEVRPQVVGPPEPAALPAPQQPCMQFLARNKFLSSSQKLNTVMHAVKHRDDLQGDRERWIEQRASMQLQLQSQLHAPASLGTARQQHWPLPRMKLTSFWSSSAVHGPFFNPTLSQHGCRPIGVARS